LSLGWENDIWLTASFCVLLRLNATNGDELQYQKMSSTPEGCAPTLSVDGRNYAITSGLQSYYTLFMVTPAGYIVAQGNQNRNSAYKRHLTPVVTPTSDLLVTNLENLYSLD